MIKQLLYSCLATVVWDKLGAGFEKNLKLNLDPIVKEISSENTLLRSFLRVLIGCSKFRPIIELKNEH